MNFDSIILITGFLLAGFSVIGNDVIQTLGTFLTSNHKKNWFTLWIFAAVILTAVLIFGWYVNDGDVSFGRLSMIPFPEDVKWWFVLSPLLLLILTRFGLPVSTTFIVLSTFSGSVLINKMITKSVIGYGSAFILAFVIYLVITNVLERKFIEHSPKNVKVWTALQWASTAFLWSQWLIQDFANIYVFLPRKLMFIELLLTLIVLLSFLAIIFYQKGGKIQKVVTSKTNTKDIRSATVIDAVYGIALLIFTVVNPIPMSTTLAFVGVLAGREVAIKYILTKRIPKKTTKLLFADLGKVFVGFIVSLFLVTLLKYFGEI